LLGVAGVQVPHAVELQPPHAPAVLPIILGDFSMMFAPFKKALH
jgi:hypothetical protein